MGCHQVSNATYVHVHVLYLLGTIFDDLSPHGSIDSISHMYHTSQVHVRSYSNTCLCKDSHTHVQCTHAYFISAEVYSVTATQSISIISHNYYITSVHKCVYMYSTCNMQPIPCNSYWVKESYEVLTPPEDTCCRKT